MTTLRQEREAAGIKQLAVAEAVGVSRHTYCKYEKNPRAMPVDALIKACNYIRCDVRSLFLFDNVKLNDIGDSNVGDLQ